MKMRKGMALMALAVLTACAKPAPPPAESWPALIAAGEFTRAEQEIRALLARPEITTEKRRELEFEIERMQRIRRDFPKSEAEVLEFIRTVIPDADSLKLAAWEQERSLEMLRIDGEKRYFRYAARNLFRINAACRKIWQAAHPDEEAPAGGPGSWTLDDHIKRIIAGATPAQPWAEPVRLHIDYTLTVNADAVPAGETLRCWLPFPREIPGRQTDIRLISTWPEKHVLADTARLQRTLYLEQTAVAATPARFNVVYEYTSFGSFHRIDAEKVTPADPQGPLQPWLQEEPPHIVFTPELRALAQQLTGGETNPYRIAQKIYAWVEENVPWASAREYSTIPNIPMYAYENHHGDCGIQHLTFITLCRLCGIPARWQSGWEFKPPTDSMHDWGMLWFAPYGWVPVDVTYGEREAEDPAHRWFYIGGMDSYRLIFNDAISQPFDPPKQHFRSETVDSQRGEVEWRGGNLYFDQWDWEMKWRVVEP
ncbi:MAG TPA: transglutaminase domain-containing protein [bacterium]|nr:transglutaminase domain-containing protein [bacterium]HQG44331.1 transglutaminase domain-containing protein [bacterium]HQI48591.1 transglutaminase domain-containing protein [bacterium]HQJ63082.1 transglutaminase domain-containing protein [bacterium]